MKNKYKFEPFCMAFFIQERLDSLAQRNLWTFKGLFGLQTALGQNRGLRFGYMTLKRGSFFTP